MSQNNGLPSGMRDRVRGMFLSAAVGDALGWPQEQRSSIVGGQKARRVPPRAEFREWERNSGTRFSRYRETVGAGEYSDDTQMLLAVARACLSHDWRSLLTTVELPALLLYERGAGRTILGAAQTWADGAPPWAHLASKRDDHDVWGYYNAGANGVAMRIAAHVVLTAAQPSPEPLIGRVITAVAAAYAAARAAARPMSGLLLTAFLSKADTDTLASMTASLLGTLHGTEWNESLTESVQDSQCLNAIADRLAAAASSARGREATMQLPFDTGHTAWKQVRRRDIARFRDELERFSERSSGTFLDGRHFTVTTRGQLATSEKNIVTRWRLHLNDGQTLFIDWSRRASKTRESVSKPPRSGEDTEALIGKAGPSLQPASKQSADLIWMTLVVRDLDRSLRFYRDVLGLSVQREDETKARVGEWLLLLMTDNDNDTFIPTRRMLLTVRTDDLVTVWQAARDFNVEVLSDRPSSGNNRIRLRDPDGNAIVVLPR